MTGQRLLSANADVVNVNYSLALFLTILLFSILGLLFFYEFFSKKTRKVRGRKKFSKSSDFASADINQPYKSDKGKSTALRSARVNPKWSDWKYRIWVELHRKSMLTVDDAVKAGGVSQKKVEKYLDRLEADGRIQPTGDSARGIFYKVMEN